MYWPRESYYLVPGDHPSADHFLMNVRDHVTRVYAILKACFAELNYAANVVPVLAKNAVADLPERQLI